MPSKTVTLKNKLGFHARAASAFVKLSSKFEADITLHKDGQAVNGKSILGIMTLAAGEGTLLELTASGRDADLALQELTSLIDNRFGED